MKADGICKDGFVVMSEAGQEKTEVMPILSLLHDGLNDHLFDVDVDGGVIYGDDLTGHILDPKLVRLAGQKELDFFESKHVWSLKAFEESRRRTGKPPVTARWMDVNKGDDVSPNIWSRLVARFIATR